MKLPKIGAIVVNYNNPTDTKRTLASLNKFCGKGTFHLMIYLVNNGCTDLESPLLKIEFPDIVQIDTPKNLGFGTGNNLAIKRALADSCSHLLLINNDATIISDDFFEKLLKSKYDISAPQIEYKSGKKTIYDYGGKCDYIFGRNTHLSSPGQADYYSGACLFIKIDVIKKLKGFDNNFFLYYEDVDLCLRAKKAGFSLGLVPETKIHHLLSASTNKLGSQKLKYLAQSHIRFCKKHLSIFVSPLYISFNIFLKFKSALLSIRSMVFVVPKAS